MLHEQRLEGFEISNEEPSNKELGVYLTRIYARLMLIFLLSRFASPPTRGSTRVNKDATNTMGPVSTVRCAAAQRCYSLGLLRTHYSSTCMKQRATIYEHQMVGQRCMAHNGAALLLLKTFEKHHW
jgi:hypothetical protein